MTKQIKEEEERSGSVTLVLLASGSITAHQGNIPMELVLSRNSESSSESPAQLVRPPDFYPN